MFGHELIRNGHILIGRHDIPDFQASEEEKCRDVRVNNIRGQVLDCSSN